MTTEEIEKAANEYQERIYTDVYEEGSLEEQKLQCLNDFKAGADFANKHWQEKTRWKSLETEPPTNYTYGKMYLLRTESERPYLVPLPYKESVEEFISCGFIEWKEIE